METIIKICCIKQYKQRALNLLNNKQTMHIKFHCRSDLTQKEKRNPQLSQFDPVTQIILPNGVPVLPT